MNGIEKITQRMEDDAQREINEVLTAARAQADEITRLSREQADKESAAIVARGESAAAEREKRLESMAGMESRKLVLAAKQEVLDEAFSMALEKLCTLPDEEYIELLAALAVKAARTGREKVIFSQKDRNRVGKAVVTKANDALTPERAPSWTRWSPAPPPFWRAPACSPWPRRPGPSRAASSCPTATWRPTAPLKPWSASSGRTSPARWPRSSSTNI